MCAWDLREAVALHASALSAALKVASGIRAPSYSTDALSSGFDHHCCRVVSCTCTKGGGGPNALSNRAGGIAVESYNLLHARGMTFCAGPPRWVAVYLMEDTG